jgi:hypothetical protein
MKNTIKTFSELRKALGTDGQDSGTECGWIVFNNQELYVRRHWSYGGGYPIYLDEACLYSFGKLQASENDNDWFPIIIDGIHQKCVHNLYKLYDCNVLLVKQNEKLNLFIDKYWDDQSVIYSQATEFTDKRLLLLFKKENFVNPFETISFFREYAYNYKCMICKKNTIK